MSENGNLEEEITDMYIGGFNRSLCSVLDEMRKANETRNYSYLLSLIEEAQVLGNRMEAGLADNNDIRRFLKYRHQLKTAVKKLKKEYDDLKAEVNKK